MFIPRELLRNMIYYLPWQHDGAISLNAKLHFPFPFSSASLRLLSPYDVSSVSLWCPPWCLSLFLCVFCFPAMYPGCLPLSFCVFCFPMLSPGFLLLFLCVFCFPMLSLLVSSSVSLRLLFIPAMPPRCLPVFVDLTL